MNILLTGATGYIGKRLLPVLVNKGHKVYCVVRDRNRFNPGQGIVDKIEIVETDFLYRSDIKKLPHNIDAAYYLIHSLLSSKSDFLIQEKQTAINFREYIEKNNVKRAIYLGGIYNDNNLSKHLSSRQNVERILCGSNVPVTVLRAGIIVGSGSASFEIIRDLVERVPIMFTPKKINTRTQPIAIRNVIDYLVGCIENQSTSGKIFEIGGPDILTYKDMLKIFAQERQYTRFFFSVPFLPVSLTSYWLYFITSTPYRLVHNLLESLKNEIIVQNNDIRKYITTELIDYRQAIRLAFDKIQQNMVISSWKDALASSRNGDDLSLFIEVPVFGCYADKREKSFSRPTEEVLTNIWNIGGKHGWYSPQWLWEIRGFLSKLGGGVGLNRGRRDSEELHMGDALDFWRVIVADKNKMRLLLYAEMSLPGEAWLELKINTGQPNILILTATFRPKGILGRFYWFSVLPFHSLIFGRMLNNMVKL
ncbi:MAG: SDR family oxidoreductase [Bacteroidales bacterium]